MQVLLSEIHTKCSWVLDRGPGREEPTVRFESNFARTMKLMNWLVTALLLLLAAGQPAAAAATAKTAKSTAASLAGKPARSKSIARDPWLGAIVLDAATGKVLFEDQANAKGYPASVLKLMDLLIILEKIEQKQLTLQDQVLVSAKASHTGGSRVWLKEKESFTVDEMLYALMIQSANDAAVALAMWKHSAQVNSQAQ